MKNLSNVMNALSAQRQALDGMGYTATIFAKPYPRLYLDVGTVYFVECRGAAWVAGIVENDADIILREDTNFLAALGEIFRQAGL